MHYKDFFKGKRITVMGLGLIGKGAINPAFLAECGADVIATDLKTEEELRPTIDKLKHYPNITFHLGEHRMEDFEGVDMVLKNQGVPLDSPYIAHALAHGVAVEMDESLFAKLVPEVVLVGVTGTRGKSTTTSLIYDIIKLSGKRVFISGNLPGKAVLPLLSEVQSGDIVVLELSSWQLQGFGDAELSPHIAVFTTFMDDHLNYYGGDREKYFRDKSSIYRFQKPEDTLVASEDVAQVIASKDGHKGNLVIARRSDVSKEWDLKILGEHNLLNISCAIAACDALGVSMDVIRQGVESFAGVPGRLQFVKDVRGIKIYNDNNATTPDATIAALRAVDATHTIIIAGGADKGLDLGALSLELAKCKKVILLAGTGTDKLKIGLSVYSEVASMKEAVDMAFKEAQSGDTVLLSPAFASFGLFKNEYDRNDQFLKLIQDIN